MALRTSRLPETVAKRSPLPRLIIIGSVVALLVVGALGYRLWAGTSGAAAGSLDADGNVLMLVAPAFLAGLLSFLSPCTLPILPTYFAFTFGARHERMVQMTVAFFLGLATTMIVLGATASALSQVVFQHRQLLAGIGGIVIVGFGIMSLVGKGFGGVMLLQRPRASVAGSFAYGATFALGWTSCVGPILGALLTMLATQGGTVLQGAVLSFIYALGLGTPLILGAEYVARRGPDARVWRVLRGRGFTVRIGRHTAVLHSTSVVSGLLLIVTGLMLATGQLAVWSQWSLQAPVTQWLLGVEDRISWLFVGS
jgi:cytochrome c-type biogenesis protein